MYLPYYTAFRSLGKHSKSGGATEAQRVDLYGKIWRSYEIWEPWPCPPPIPMPMLSIKPFNKATQLQISYCCD